MTASNHVQPPFMKIGGGDRRRHSILWLLLAAIVAGAFIYAGALKIGDPVKFARDITNFRLVGWSIAIRMALYLPWLEIICGLALFLPFLRRGALAILTALMLVFIAATIAAQARGISLDCGCFGGASKGMTFTTHMLIDLALLGGIGALWLLPARSAR